MISRTHVFALAAAILTSLPAGASVITQFASSFWVLGDSLSADGSTSGGIVATDGKVWNEDIIADFATAGKPTGNFAFLGATASGFRDEPGAVDLPGQVQDFLAASAGLLGPNPLVSLWFGGNDILRAGTDPASQAAVLDQALTNIGNAVQAMALAGVGDFLIFNLPDLALIPATQPLFSPGGEFEGFSPTDPLNPVTQATVNFNTLLQTILPPSLNVKIVDFFTLSRQFFADPTAFGVQGFGPCIVDGVQLIPDCSTVVWWDPLHPSSTIHQRIEEEARAAIVPLPASAVLLFASLGVLTLLGRRSG